MRTVFTLLFLLLLGQSVPAQLRWTEKRDGGFSLFSDGKAAPILLDSTEPALVHKAGGLLQLDLEQLSGIKTSLLHAPPSSNGDVIIAGTLNSKWIRQLVGSKKLVVGSKAKQWEGFQIEVVRAPFAGVRRALVICGADRRGTAFGIAELSRQMGVSPWHWWADVRVAKKQSLILQLNSRIEEAPAVKYRGIFINDEAPALSSWSKATFGGFNHRFYEKVFELMIRLKANYLWPAMWGSAFYDDDAQNRQTADDWGIVIGTSHHEPLMRAHDEWRRYGHGKWNYEVNADSLRRFWTAGMERATNEKIVTIGMRGDGDEPMSRETATALLERIVKDQRTIIESVTRKPAAETPQIWALYKEVQDYYDKGMRVPEDVTLLLCDDNWGNIRRLPAVGAAKRKGGYGIYYHFDYVGGPRNYKWINTNNIARVWEQLHLAYEYNARQIWIVNVGDIKPMELPTTFFLDYAWNPSKIDAADLPKYYKQWAAAQFGNDYAAGIAKLMQHYAQYIARRKPELLNATTYNLQAGEWYRVVMEWKDLLKQAEAIGAELPQEQQPAYYQLVLHGIKASTNLHEMYEAAANNRHYALKKSIKANSYADAVARFFENDSLITVEYHSINKGKWNGMMSQTHIGYTYWQQPPFNVMPSVVRVNPADALPAELETDTTANTGWLPRGLRGNYFYEEGRAIGIEASNWTVSYAPPGAQWKTVPGIGRTGDGITTVPVTKTFSTVASRPRTEYHFFIADTATARVYLHFSPTLDFQNEGGLRFAVAIDEAPPQEIILNAADDDVKTWEAWVANNIIIKSAQFRLSKPGKHILKYWAISPGVVLQKIDIDLGGMQQQYLGVPQTKID